MGDNLQTKTLVFHHIFHILTLLGMWIWPDLIDPFFCFFSPTKGILVKNLDYVYLRHPWPTVNQWCQSPQTTPTYQSTLAITRLICQSRHALGVCLWKCSVVGKKWEKKSMSKEKNWLAKRHWGREQGGGLLPPGSLPLSVLGSPHLPIFFPLFFPLWNLFTGQSLSMEC